MVTGLLLMEFIIATASYLLLTLNPSLALAPNHSPIAPVQKGMYKPILKILALKLTLTLTTLAYPYSPNSNP